MTKQTFQMHLYAEEGYDFDSDDTPLRYRLVPWADAKAFGAYVGPVTVEAEVPESFDIRAAKLRDKQAELQKVRAELGARITELMREINELQALPMAEVIDMPSPVVINDSDDDLPF